MTSSTKQTLAFFGATGGVTNTTLALALRASHHCTALARTPQKLIDMLRTVHAVPLETIESYLTIHTGDVNDAAAVSLVLVNPLTTETTTPALIDTIIFGIGSYPKLQWNLFTPLTLQDPHICETGTRTILTALQHLSAHGVPATSTGAKPLLLSVSTTGISPKARDVPWLLTPLYRWALHVPHEDKKSAEYLLAHDEGAHLRGCVVVRPTLLTDAVPRGVSSLRVGWEWSGDESVRGGVVEPGPRMGWSVGRRDVGAFMFEEVICKGGWEGRCVSLTY